MSNQDFQERLRRINAGSGPAVQLSNQSRTEASTAKAGKPAYQVSYIGIAIGATLLAGGFQAIRLTNSHYDALRETLGQGVAMLAGVASLALPLIGAMVLLRSALKGRAGPKPPAAQRRQASALAKTIWSLIGLAMGIIGCLYMVFAGGARFVDGERARHFVIGATAIFLIFALIAAIFGIVSIFLRGRALARVPACFLLGTLLTYGWFRFFRVNVLEWPQFIAMLQ